MALARALGACEEGDTFHGGVGLGFGASLACVTGAGPSTNVSVLFQLGGGRDGGIGPADLSKSLSGGAGEGSVVTFRAVTSAAAPGVPSRASCPRRSQHWATCLIAVAGTRTTTPRLPRGTWWGRVRSRSRVPGRARAMRQR